MALQLLAADKEAERLRSTGIPILQFSAPPFLGGLKMQGSQSLMASLVMASKGIAAACLAVTSNGTIMTKLQVTTLHLQRNMMHCESHHSQIHRDCHLRFSYALRLRIY